VHNHACAIAGPAAYRLRELDEAEPARTVRGLVKHHLGAHERAELAEVGPHLLVRHSRVQAADKHLAWVGQ
jgi:hypothetical protein